MNTLHHCTRNRLPSFSAAANARDCLMPRATPSCQGRHLVEERPRQQASRLATTADSQCAGPAPGLLTGRAAHAVSRTESNGTAATPAARGGASSPRSVAKWAGVNARCGARARAAADYRACCAATFATESASRQRTLLCLHGTRRFPLPPSPLSLRASPSDKSNHFKIGEINDQNFAAMPENRR